jgi:hypothetical protein
MDSESKVVLLIVALVIVPIFLLVAAIVGGAIFATVQDSECLQETSGFLTEDVQVDEFGVSDGKLFLSLRNTNVEELEVRSVDIASYENSTNYTIPIGDTETYSFEGFEDSECSEANVSITYLSEGQEMEINGTIRGKFAYE